MLGQVCKRKPFEIIGRGFKGCLFPLLTTSQQCCSTEEKIIKTEEQDNSSTTCRYKMTQIRLFCMLLIHTCSPA